MLLQLLSLSVTHSELPHARVMFACVCTQHTSPCARLQGAMHASGVHVCAMHRLIYWRMLWVVGGSVGVVDVGWGDVGYVRWGCGLCGGGGNGFGSVV